MHELQFELNHQGDLLEVNVQGSLDNDSSVHFRDIIDENVREGWHRILVDLSRVTYLSSAGIGVLLVVKQQIDQLHGLFGICNPTPQVENVLRRTGVLDVLRCDLETARTGGSVGSMTLLSNSRIASEEGLSLEIYSLNGLEPLRCRVIGQPPSAFNSNSGAQRQSIIECGRSTFGLGMGAIGNDFEPSKPDLGEIVSVAGAAAQSPRTNGGLPDYSLAKEDFTPGVRLLYGVQCEGDLPMLIRFSPAKAGERVALSKLVRVGLQQAECQVAGIVILAECAGLVGAQIRQSPTIIGNDAASCFSFPEIREWLSFSAEPIHQQSLALIVGIASSESLDPSSPIHPFVRSMDEDSELSGHFHAAVFPYRPLKKRTLNLQSSASDLFQAGSIRDVLHLLRDNRSIVGPGESELTSGACWIAPIDQVSAVEDAA